MPFGDFLWVILLMGRPTPTSSDESSKFNMHLWISYWHFTIASHSGQMPASTQLYIETILTELQILDWMLPVIKGTWDHNLTMGIGTPTLVSKCLAHLLGFSYRSMLQSSVISRPCHHWLLGWSEGHFRATFQELSGLSCVRHSPREVNSWWLFPPETSLDLLPLEKNLFTWRSSWTIRILSG